MIQTEHLNPDRLNAFIDGEFPSSERQGIEHHLAGCHACTLRVLSATQLKAATARAGHRFPGQHFVGQRFVDDDRGRVAA